MTEQNKVHLYGKVAKFPKNTKANKAYSDFIVSEGKKIVQTATLFTK